MKNLLQKNRPLNETGLYGPQQEGLQFHDLGDGRVLHHGLDAVVTVALRSIHLALADNLAIGGLQREVRLAVLGHEFLKTFLLDSIFLDGFGTVQASGFRGVTLAGEDDLAVRSLEIELELTVLSHSDFKFCHSVIV